MELGQDLWGSGKCEESALKHTYSLEERGVKEEKDSDSLEAAGYM